MQTSGTESGLAIATSGPFTETSTYGAVRYELGAGVPSKPVLDTQGKNVIIQMSDGTLKREPVDLSRKPTLQVQGGWQSSDQ